MRFEDWLDFQVRLDERYEECGMPSHAPQAQRDAISEGFERRDCAAEKADLRGRWSSDVA